MTPTTRVIDVVCDTSVALKWFYDERDSEVQAARALLAGQRDGLLVAHVLDLTFYELANALLRGQLAAPSSRVAVVCEQLPVLARVIPVEMRDLRFALRLAERHGLTVYDAAYAAVARRRKAPLASTDSQLINAGLAERPTNLAKRLALPEPI